MRNIRKSIRDYVTANPACTEAEIIAACDSEDGPRRSAKSVLPRMIRRGKIIKTGENHSVA